MVKPKKTGRPSKRTDAVVDTILLDLAKGITLSEICRREGFPARETVYDWLEKDEAFSTRFARARKVGFDAIADECAEIADDGSNDWMERKNADGDVIGEQLNTEHVQRSKLRIETRLKLLAKWDPKRYGDKVALTGGGEDDKPLQIIINKPAA